MLGGLDPWPALPETCLVKWHWRLCWLLLSNGVVNINPFRLVVHCAELVCWFLVFFFFGPLAQ